jgi:hypothetical protein
MALSGIASGASHAASQQAAQSSSSHVHNGRRIQSLTDIDAQGSSVASAPGATGKIGSKVDITV